MVLPVQKPKMRLSDDDTRARYHGLRAVACALGLRDFVELRRPRRKQPHKYTPSTDTSLFSPFATNRRAAAG
jgi:hypothetical protein